MVFGWPIGEIYTPLDFNDLSTHEISSDHSFDGRLSMSMYDKQDERIRMLN